MFKTVCVSISGILLLSSSFLYVQSVDGFDLKGEIIEVIRNCGSHKYKQKAVMIDNLLQGGSLTIGTGSYIGIIFRYHFSAFNPQ